MSNLFSRLWNDDQGAIISVEMILVIGICIFGIIPGLVALRNGVNAGLGTIANVIVNLAPTFTYSGYSIFGTGSGTTIAQTGGYAFTPNLTTTLSASEVVPTPVTIFVLSPAP